MSKTQMQDLGIPWPENVSNETHEDVWQMVRDNERRAKRLAQARTDVSFYRARLFHDHNTLMRFASSNFTINVKHTATTMFHAAQILLKAWYEEMEFCIYCGEAAQDRAAGLCFGCFARKMELDLAARRASESTPGDGFAELNLLHPAKFPTRQEFTKKWTEANEEQAEGRMKRDDVIDPRD